MHWTNGDATTGAASICRVYMCIRFSLVHVDMYMFCAFWCEAMLLVVNIVTCPIGTDCGGSAPVVGVYRQPRLAEGV